MLRAVAWMSIRALVGLSRQSKLGTTVMRGIVATTILGVGVALVLLSGQPASAQTVGATQGQQTPVDLHSGPPHGSQLKAAPSAEDSAMRTMYVTMGAMTGYMFAVMPVTMTAVTAAAASGVASMWAG